jgi:hypothetical protein
MNNNASGNEADAAWRWIARIVGGLFSVLVVYIAIAHLVAGQLPNLFTQPTVVQAGLLGLVLMVIGNMAAWRWDLTGGIASLLGWGLFLVPVMHSPRSPGAFVLAMALPGALYITCAILSRHTAKQPSA